MLRSKTSGSRIARPSLATWAALAAWAVLALAAGATASAQSDVPTLEEIEQSYRVVELSRGWVLQPLSGDDFDTLEIIDGAVRIDGNELSEADLRRFVDDDADWVLAMAAGASPRSEAEPEDAPLPPDPPEPPADDEALDDEEIVDEEVVDEKAEERRRARRQYRNRRDTQVSFGSGLSIAENESVREVVLLSGPLTVDGEVDGDATVILGSARVSGRIDGSLTVVGGPVYLASTAVIEGDLVAVGGSVRREAGAEVDGEITQVGIGEVIDVGDLRIDFGRPNLFWPSFELFDFSWPDLFGRAVGFGLLAVILLFVLLLAPNKVEAAGERARVEPLKSGLVGLLVEVLFVPLLGLVCVILLVSIVGIPLLIFVLPLMCLAVAFYLLLGFAGVSLTTGRWLQNRFDWKGLGIYLLLLAGLAFLYGWSILGEAMSVTPWPIRMTAILLLMLGFCLKYVAWTVGLGAAVLDQFSPLPATATTLDPRWTGTSTPAPATPDVSEEPSTTGYGLVDTSRESPGDEDPGDGDRDRT